ncbi:hypothetical protein M514_24246 [Trichuris suis]|uniref:Polysaccharide biosynthesis domain-containing protein n=1 Tax=Trichuris suis TaxID=68888 RepID=A0A085N237_9BILA|nr:hypothetical protein M514_24246 [Trichuris suis]
MDMEVGDVEGLAAALNEISVGIADGSSVESAWAMLAYENADKHMDLISSCDCRFLHLSCCDEEIYGKFREVFPDMPLDMIDEEVMRSAPMKERWRKFGELFKHKVEDYNFVPKIQFLAIEIARNREGFNGRMRA